MTTSSATLKPLHDHQALLPLQSPGAAGSKGKFAIPLSGNLLPVNAGDHLTGAKAPLSHDQKVTQEAQKWVAQTFYGTLLKQMHESPFKSELFDGGRGGQAFTSMYDERLAERMSRGAGQKLVKSIVRRIEGNKAYAKNAKSAGSPHALMNSATLSGGASGNASQQQDQQRQSSQEQLLPHRHVKQQYDPNPYGAGRSHVAASAGA